MEGCIHWWSCNSPRKLRYICTQSLKMFYQKSFPQKEVPFTYFYARWHQAVGCLHWLKWMLPMWSSLLLVLLFGAQLTWKYLANLGSVSKNKTIPIVELCLSSIYDKVCTHPFDGNEEPHLTSFPFDHLAQNYRNTILSAFRETKKTVYFLAFRAEWKVWLGYMQAKLETITATYFK